jgi:hypothetical protein
MLPNPSQALLELCLIVLCSSLRGRAKEFLLDIGLYVIRSLAPTHLSDLVMTCDFSGGGAHVMPHFQLQKRPKTAFQSS